MARTKSTRSASSNRSSGSSSTGGRKSSRSARSGSSSMEENSSEDEGLSSTSFARARDFVEENANLQTAGIALAGAGILALVSTQAGRNLIKSAADAVVNLVSQNMASFRGESDDEVTNTRQKPSRQRDQASI